MSTISPPATSIKATSRRGPHWANGLAIAAMLALVLGPLIFVGTRTEIAAWHAARGGDAAWDGDHDQAITHYNQALEWNPNSAAYLAARAKAKLELGQVSEAVKDALRATELSPRNVTAQFIYTTALLRAGRGKEAAAFFEDKLPYLGIYDDAKRASLQNSIAATLATANLDLDRAFKHIKEALAFLEEHPVLANTPHEQAFIDTRAMVLYRQGEYAKALTDMDKVLADPAKQALQVERDVNSASVDDRHRAAQLREARRGLAQMLYHRVLIHEALAKQAKDDDQRISHEIQAVDDRQRIRDLGFTPEESLF